MRKEEIAAADYPGIRLLKVAKSWKPEPQNDIEGTWKVCSPKTVAEGGWGGFSACAYYFGRELHKKLGVAVGLIDSTWGGTRIESWTPPEGFAAVPALKQEYELVQLGDPRTAAHQQRLEQVLQETEQWLAAARQALTEHALVPAMPTYPAELLPPHDLQQATALYNGHDPSAPALRLARGDLVSGRVEQRRGDAVCRADEGADWRLAAGVGRGRFPVLLRADRALRLTAADPEVIGEFWEAQAAAQAVPNTGMAVINDIGDLKDIHPKNKQEVGRRLALWALAKTYGQEKLVYSGPTFKAMTIEGDKLRADVRSRGRRAGQPGRQAAELVRDH